MGKFLWLAVGVTFGAVGLFLLYPPTDNVPTASTTASSTQAVSEPLATKALPGPALTEAAPEPAMTEAVSEPLATKAVPGPAVTEAANPRSASPAQDAKPSTTAPATPAATAGYLNGSSLSTSGIVTGPANYNDYYGLNGGSECEQPIYDKWGNVSGFRKGNC